MVALEPLKYLSAYGPELTDRVRRLLADGSLGQVLLQRYPSVHEIRTDRALYDYAQNLKEQYLRQSAPLSKVVYDDKIHVINHALGLHTYASRVQGNRLKSKNEIRVASVFRRVPEPFLKMIVVHELAHLKEKDHNKAFYRLCEYMEPAYHQLEFDLRVYLTHLDLVGDLF